MDQKESEHQNYLRLRCQLDVEDVTMIEERTWSRITGPAHTEAKLFVTQRRQIGDKFIRISEENGNSLKTTDLSQKEEKEFEDKWKRLWNHKIFDDIQTAISTETDEERLKDRLKELLSQGQI